MTTFLSLFAAWSFVVLPEASFDAPALAVPPRPQSSWASEQRTRSAAPRVLSIVAASTLPALCTTVRSLRSLRARAT